MASNKNTVDTPRKGSWYTQVNQPGFIPSRPKPQSVKLRTISAAEYRELQPVFNGRG
ncbi:MAG: hypothetical protein GY774_22290 [Planctomycetes bacterium]|nr:hypothetical protein [Planctomycetota bacterium]